jgi:hypothetical protein
MQEDLFGNQEPAKNKSAKKLTTAQKIAAINELEIQEVFNYWVDQTWIKRGPRPKLTDPRWRKIALAIYEYGLEEAKMAIRGCTLSSFHMGDNKMRRRYTDIELVLRDAAHIERFISLTVEEDSRGKGDF